MKPDNDLIKIDDNRIAVSLNLIGYQEGDNFIVFSPALDLYAFGDNEEEAFTAFDTTAKIYFEEVIKSKRLEKDLSRLGWKKHHHFKKRLHPPKYNPNEIMSKKDIDTFKVQLGRQIPIHA